MTKLAAMITIIGTLLPSAVFAALPAPPLMFEVPYERPAGKTITVASGGNLQAAIDGAALGDTIVLQAGAVFNGPIVLRNKTSGSGWIYIQSSAYTSLPAPGVRVSSTLANFMPKIQVAPGIGAAIQTEPGAHHYRLIGLEVSPKPGNFIYEVIKIGDSDTSTLTLPRHIVIDRSYIHGDPTAGTRRGVAMNGAHVAVVDSYVSDIKEAGSDSQALWAHNTSGPLKIVNNHLEASGENVMFGGADSAAASLVPSDIEIRRNYFYKPLSWIGSPWTVKNLLEFKSARRVLVEDNDFANNWAAAQTGFSILITPRNQDGSAPWSVTSDIAFVSNRLRNLGQGINISGTDDVYPSLRTERLLIRNNFIEITALNGADGRALQLLNSSADITFDHNTIVGAAVFMMSESSQPIDRVAITNNIFLGRPESYGFIGTGTGEGLSTFNKFFSNLTFSKNLLVGNGTASNYPTNTYFQASISGVGFQSAATGNYLLSSSSPYKNAGTDGQDIGTLASLPATKVPKPPGMAIN
jgi:hypothetical protein